MIWKTYSNYLHANFCSLWHSCSSFSDLLTFLFQYIICVILLGTGIRGLMRGMATLPQGNQELFVVRDKSWKTPRWAWGEQFRGIWYFYLQCFDSWPCWLGDRKGIRSVKNWVMVCWWWWFDWSFARLIAPVVTTASIILCFNEHRLTKFTWKMAIKTQRICVILSDFQFL